MAAVTAIGIPALVSGPLRVPPFGGTWQGSFLFPLFRTQGKRAYKV